jgi:hypothetical protein
MEENQHEEDRNKDIEDSYTDNEEIGRLIIITGIFYAVFITITLTIIYKTL